MHVYIGYIYICECIENIFYLLQNVIRVASDSKPLETPFPGIIYLTHPFHPKKYSFITFQTSDLSDWNDFHFSIQITSHYRKMPPFKLFFFLLYPFQPLTMENNVVYFEMEKFPGLLLFFSPFLDIFHCYTLLS